MTSPLLKLADVPALRRQLASLPPDLGPGVLRPLDSHKAATYWHKPAAEFDAWRFDGATGFDALIGLLELKRQQGVLPLLSPRPLAALHKHISVPRMEIAARLVVSRVYYTKIATTDRLCADWTARIYAAFALALQQADASVCIPSGRSMSDESEEAARVLFGVEKRFDAQHELVTKLGITQQTLWRWRRRGVPRSHAARVLAAAHIHLPEVLEGVADAPGIGV